MEKNESKLDSLNLKAEVVENIDNDDQVQEEKKEEKENPISNGKTSQIRIPPSNKELKNLDQNVSVK